MVRQKDIADTLGIDQSQVSRAFKGDIRVAKETRDKILAQAARMGYRPTIAASALASRRHHKSREQPMRIAFLFFHPRAGVSQMARSIQTHAQQLGYDVETLQMNETTDFAALGRRLWATGVSGIILPTTDGARLPAKLISHFPWQQFSAVKIGRVQEDLSLPLVRVSAAEMVGLAVDRLLKRGYRAIHCEFIRTPSRLDDQVRLGILSGSHHWFLPENTRLSWSFDGGPATVAGETLSDRLRESRADVLLSFPAERALPLLNQGWRIPEDIAVAGIGVDERTRVGDKTVAGVTRNISGQAQAAVRLLHEQICKGQTGIQPLPNETLVAPSWQDGQTL